MGTIFSVEIYGTNPQQLTRAADDSLAEARRIDRMLSNYRAESELSRLNAQAARNAVEVSPELFELLAECIRVSDASEGTFDITVGPLMKVWGFYKDSGHMPVPADLAQARQRIGYRYIELDKRRHAVHFKKPGIELDPGGVGKGYAVDRIVSILRADSIRSAFISAGGSSIYGLGAPPNEPRGWRVQLADPRDEHRVAATAYLNDTSLGTSGSYEKFFWADGKVYGHIMDPRTGYPAQGMIAVSIIAPRAIDSEIWAKPYFIQGRNWTCQHRPRSFRILMCPDGPGQICSWLPEARR
jgi:FAD:protein FMN transferase